MEFDYFRVVDALHYEDFSLNVFTSEGIFDYMRKDFFESIVFTMQFDFVDFRVAAFADILFFLPFVVNAHV